MPKSVTCAQPTHPKKSGCGGRENGGGEMTFPRLVRPLLDLVASGAERGAGDSVEVIDREIESLMRAREYFLQWVTLLREEERVDGGESGSSDRAGQSARQKGARPGSQSKRLGFSPGQFLRAWSESTWAPGRQWPAPGLCGTGRCGPGRSGGPARSPVWGGWVVPSRCRRRERGCLILWFAVTCRGRGDLSASPRHRNGT